MARCCRLWLALACLFLAPSSTFAWDDGESGSVTANADVDDPGEGADAVRRLGGHVEFEENDPAKSVIAVDFGGSFPKNWFNSNQIRKLNSLRRIERATCNGFSVGDDRLRVLDYLPNLRHVEIFQTCVTSAGLRHLTALKNLKELTVGENMGIGNEGMKYIGRLKTLEVLDLHDTAVGDAGLKELKGLACLRDLTLTGTDVTDDGLEALQAFPHLEWLDLCVNDAITDKALDHLAKLRNIRTINLYATKVTDEAVARFKRQRPEVRISKH